MDKNELKEIQLLIVIACKILRVTFLILRTDRKYDPEKHIPATSENSEMYGNGSKRGEKPCVQQNRREHYYAPEILRHGFRICDLVWD